MGGHGRELSITWHMNTLITAVREGPHAGRMLRRDHISTCRHEDFSEPNDQVSFRFCDDPKSLLSVLFGMATQGSQGGADRYIRRSRRPYE